MSTRMWTGEQIAPLSSHWWLTILRGVVAVLFGIAVLSRPVLSVGVLLLLFGAFALASGILAVIASISLMVHHKNWWAMLFEGIAGILVGLLTFYLPVLTAAVLLIVVASWAIVTGVFELIAAIAGIGSGSVRGLMAVSGVLSVLLGVLLFTYPVTGLATIAWFIGFYALLFGVSQVILGFQMRKLDRWLETHGRAAAA